MSTKSESMEYVTSKDKATAIILKLFKNGHIDEGEFLLLNHEINKSEPQPIPYYPIYPNPVSPSYPDQYPLGPIVTYGNNDNSRSSAGDLVSDQHL